MLPEFGGKTRPKMFQISNIEQGILDHRGLACFADPVLAEVSKHELRRRGVRPSIPQGERLSTDTITLIRDEPEFRTAELTAALRN
jgi:c-di-GMP-binding flagellar brake protein YcgR